MSNLSMREQLLITSILLIIFIIAGIWGMQKFDRQEKILLQQLAKLENKIKKVSFQSKELKDIKRSATASVMLQALSSFVEKIARSLEIQDNLQLNELTNLKNGTEGVKVGLDRLKLDDLMQMLYQLENHRPVLRTSHLSISISPGNRQIRASFHVHKQLGE